MSRYNRGRGNTAMMIMMHLSTRPEGVTVHDLVKEPGLMNRRRVQEVISDLYRARIIRRRKVKRFTKRGTCFNNNAYYY